MIGAAAVRRWGLLYMLVVDRVGGALCSDRLKSHHDNCFLWLAHELSLSCQPHSTSQSAMLHAGSRLRAFSYVVFFACRHKHTVAVWECVVSADCCMFWSLLMNTIRMCLRGSSDL